jgi:hypothetical protein
MVHYYTLNFKAINPEEIGLIKKGKAVYSL